MQLAGNLTVFLCNFKLPSQASLKKSQATDTDRDLVIKISARHVLQQSIMIKKIPQQCFALLTASYHHSAKQKFVLISLIFF